MMRLLHWQISLRLCQIFHTWLKRDWVWPRHIFLLFCFVFVFCNNRLNYNSLQQFYSYFIKYCTYALCTLLQIRKEQKQRKQGRIPTTKRKSKVIFLLWIRGLFFKLLWRYHLIFLNIFKDISEIFVKLFVCNFWCADHYWILI